MEGASRLPEQAPAETPEHVEAAPPEVEGASRSPHRVPASEWVTRYVEELGYPPACAEHLQAFVAHRGGRLAYRAARQAIAQAAGRSSGRSTRRDSPPRPPGLRHRGVNIQSSDATTFARTGSNSQPVQTGGWVNTSDREAALRDLLPAFHSEARVNPEAAIRRLLVAVEHEARLAAEVESMRILAALPRVDDPGTCRECAICLDTEEPRHSGGEVSPEEEQVTGGSASTTAAVSASAAPATASATRWLKLPCGHVYHESCLGNWFRQSNHRSTCPLCRIDVGTAVDSTSSTAEVIEPQIERQESHESDVIDTGSSTPEASLSLAREDSGQQPPENQGAAPL